MIFFRCSMAQLKKTGQMKALGTQGNTALFYLESED